jgi:hypothetical protein
LEVTFDDPKTFTKPFTLHMEKTLTPDTEIIEDVCENERDSSHLESGVKVASEVLAKYAGTYQIGTGRQVVVTALGEQLSIEDSANPLDRLFVARSETVFLSSVSQAVVEFFRDPQGAVTHFVRTGAGKDEKAVRSGGLPASRTAIQTK